MKNSNEYKNYDEYSDISVEVAIRIKKLRIEHGYNREQFADALGISSSTVKNHEGYIKKPYSPNSPWSIFDLIKASNLFKVDLDYLLGRQSEKRHEIKQLKELTGLSEKTCEQLEEYLTEKREAETALQWFIENGFLELIREMDNDARLLNEMGKVGYNKVSQLGDYTELIVKGVAEEKRVLIESLVYAYYDNQSEQIATRRGRTITLMRKYLQETLKKMSKTELQEIIVLEKDESEEDDGQENT